MRPVCARLWVLGVVSAVLGVLALVGPSCVRARESAVFALIVGVNRGSHSDVPDLQYADDDAARYYDLFRSLGARAYLLSRLDANTRRLHPQARAEAVTARYAELEDTLVALKHEIERAHTRGADTVLYVTYAGHGSVEDSTLYLTLDDTRLPASSLLATILERAHADRSHVIIDACHADLLAMARGPGGTRRPLDGFVEFEAMAARVDGVGYVLSSSQSGESHEWAGFEAGIFSHEVRSGLYGAADADADGRVTYAEIAAFVARANQAITAERFRPHVLVRAPRDHAVLLDLPARGEGELILDAPDTRAHYLLETEQGVRVLDFHGSGEVAVHLTRPPGTETLYLRNLSADTERTVPSTGPQVPLSRLPVLPSRVRGRGAAQHAFNQIFSLPFDMSSVAGLGNELRMPHMQRDARTHFQDLSTDAVSTRRTAAFVAIGIGVAAALSGGAVELSAGVLRAGAPAQESQRDTAARNRAITGRNQLATGLTLGAVGTGLVGAVLLLWPTNTARADAASRALTELATGFQF